jgi:hypothetical protein
LDSLQQLVLVVRAERGKRSAEASAGLAVDTVEAG